VINFFRFEGAANPSYTAILCAVETNSGEQGKLADAYEPYSDTFLKSFMLNIEIMLKNQIEKISIHGILLLG